MAIAAFGIVVLIPIGGLVSYLNYQDSKITSGQNCDSVDTRLRFFAKKAITKEEIRHLKFQIDEQKFHTATKYYLGLESFAIAVVCDKNGTVVIDLPIYE